jgi:guanyl-specific ribonuclease Sa
MKKLTIAAMVGSFLLTTTAMATSNFSSTNSDTAKSTKPAVTSSYSKNSDAKKSLSSKSTPSQQAALLKAKKSAKADSTTDLS